MNRPYFPPGLLRRGARAASPALLATAVGIALAMLQAPPSYAAAWRFEVEDAVASGRCNNAGGSPFSTVSCGAASGGHALEGLDAAGDWLEFDVNLETEAVLADSVRCASVDQVSWQFLVEFYPEGSLDPAASSQHSKVVGRGIT